MSKTHCAATPYTKTPYTKTHYVKSVSTLIFLVIVCLFVLETCVRKPASANSPIAVDTIHDRMGSRITLNWGAPVGWEIKAAENGIHRIVFYKNGIADFSKLDLSALPEVLDLRQQQTADTLVLSLKISKGSRLKVAWVDGTSLIDIYPKAVAAATEVAATEVGHTNLLYNKQRQQRQTGKTASSIPPDTPATGSDLVFEGAIDEIFPLSPKQIDQFGQSLQRQEDAIDSAYSIAPDAIVRALPISLASDAPVETINLATNHITTMIFLDATGQPWPINSVAVGTAFSLVGFNQQNSSETYDMQGAHEIRLIPKKRLNHGNISISLKNLPTPVVLKLVAARNIADYRVDIRISEYGPNAIQPIVDVPDEIKSANATILHFLSGVPPSGAQALTISGALPLTKVWEHDGLFWIKTKSTVLSPGYSQRAGSPDGTFVYTMKSTPVVIVSNEGIPRKIIISGGSL